MELLAASDKFVKAQRVGGRPRLFGRLAHRLPAHRSKPPFDSKTLTAKRSSGRERRRAGVREAAGPVAARRKAGGGALSPCKAVSWDRRGQSDRRVKGLCTLLRC